MAGVIELANPRSMLGKKPVREPLSAATKFSASLDRRSENISVLAIVITELKFGNIERHIFPAHFVKSADYAALEDRPEALNGLSMDCSDDVFAPCMVHSGMRIFAVKTLVTSPLVSAEQTDFMRDRFTDEGFQ